MASTTSSKNRMLDIIGGYLDRYYLLSTPVSLNSDESGLVGKYAGYSGGGNRYVPITWASATGGSKTTSNSPSSTPIMFAVPASTSIGQIVYVDTGTSKIVATFSVSSAYANDGAYYVRYETLSIE